jgi:hypothetical protein
MTFIHLLIETAPFWAFASTLGLGMLLTIGVQTITRNFIAKNKGSK